MEKNVDGIYMIDLSRITIDIPALAVNAGYTTEESLGDLEGEKETLFASECFSVDAQYTYSAGRDAHTVGFFAEIPADCKVELIGNPQIVPIDGKCDVVILIDNFGDVTGGCVKESAEDFCHTYINNRNVISGGDFSIIVQNYSDGVITGGTYNGSSILNFSGSIRGGDFREAQVDAAGSEISGGIFKKGTYGITTASSCILYEEATGTYTVQGEVTLYDELPDGLLQSSGTVSSDSYTLTTGWYIVNDTLEISERITISGDVNLILADGCKLTDNKGITVLQGNALTIWGQKQGKGCLYIDMAGNNSERNAGIGGVNGNAASGLITINGGTLYVRGGNHSAGIGGGRGAGISRIVINGGDIKAYSGGRGAGIGAGLWGNAEVTVAGGKVYAEGSNNGCGIGGASCTNRNTGAPSPTFDAKVTITGGEVTAKGSLGGAGIGGGSNSTIEISGGTVSAEGGSMAAGIGGGYQGAGGDITISGGKITARGGDGAADIGCGTSCSDTSGSIVTFGPDAEYVNDGVIDADSVVNHGKLTNTETGVIKSKNVENSGAPAFGLPDKY